LFLDTRTKIVSRTELEERMRGGKARWISGQFDPLLAEHVRRLAEASVPGRPLIVEVTNSPHALLPQRARAELVAALSLVDFVVLGEGTTAADADVTERFIGHVIERHRQESAR
jgi:bifunctional ADP-heptose synthase (sugar kinase/adenylyltransferase)